MNARKISDFKYDHPEREEDEIYLGNIDLSILALSKWETKRLGEIAYDENGNDRNKDSVNKSQFFPLFVKRIEVEKKSPSTLLRRQAS